MPRGDGRRYRLCLHVPERQLAELPPREHRGAVVGEGAAGHPGGVALALLAEDGDRLERPGVPDADDVVVAARRQRGPPGKAHAADARGVALEDAELGARGDVPELRLVLAVARRDRRAVRGERD